MFLIHAQLTVSSGSKGPQEKYDCTFMSAVSGSFLWQGTRKLTFEISDYSGRRAFWTLAHRWSIYFSGINTGKQTLTVTIMSTRWHRVSIKCQVSEVHFSEDWGALTEGLFWPCLSAFCCAGFLPWWVTWLWQIRQHVQAPVTFVLFIIILLIYILIKKWENTTVCVISKNICLKFAKTKWQGELI